MCVYLCVSVLLYVCVWGDSHVTIQMEQEVFNNEEDEEQDDDEEDVDFDEDDESKPLQI